MIEIIGNRNTVLDQYIAELRDVNIQKDRLRFRKNLKRVGEIFGYEISKKLVYEQKEVNTELGSAMVPVIKDYPVLVTILRAGLPIQQGLLNIFDHAQNGFVSTYRESAKDEDFTIQVEYVSCPDINNKTLIISDAMMATGESMVKALKEVYSYGQPTHTHVVSVLCSEEGIENIRRNFSKKELSIWTAAIDDEITAQAILVPGLGDAGDLAFGNKT